MDEFFKFKSGDKVKVIIDESNLPHIPIGSTGVVMEESQVPWVKMDDKRLNTEWVSHLNDYVFCFHENELELIEGGQNV